jgi:hypothetical protein
VQEPKLPIRIWLAGFGNPVTNDALALVAQLNRQKGGPLIPCGEAMKQIEGVC